MRLRSQIPPRKSDEGFSDNGVKASATIPASEAKTEFSELLKRVQKGESFTITFRGENIARLVPAGVARREETQNVIAQMKAERSMLNPPGKPKMRVKDLIRKGRR